ncbi:glycosyltransferase [Salinibacterium sp. GXW1014]|uniref:glycosyltransferase n=1 Tax=Salinibacterium sp. GXW1014 TaxID=3377838 RepID=UPI00383A3AC3
MTRLAPGATALRAGTVLVAHPSAELYGSDRMLLESVRGLLDSGARIAVALPCDGPLSPALRDLGADVTICRSPVLRKSALTPRGFAAFLAATVGGLADGWRLITRVRPNRIYVSTLTVPLWIALAKVRRIGVLCHVHEGEASASAAVRAAIAAPLLFADEVVANSRFSVGVLAGSFPSLGRRTSVIYNGVPGPDSRQQARQALDTPLRIAYVGRLSPRKGVDVAVEALSILHRRGVPARLDLMGTVFTGYEWYEKELRDEVRLLALEPWVRFHGFVPSVWQHVESSDVVVVPSRADEPFGNTAVEAILCGRPVIASATSGLLEATAGYRASRTVPAGDAEALADCLIEMASNWHYMRSAAWKDVALAEERHSPATYRRRVVDAVLSLRPRAWAADRSQEPVLAGGRP